MLCCHDGTCLSDVAGSCEGKVQSFGADRGAAPLRHPRDRALLAEAARGAIHAATVRPCGAVLPDACKGDTYLLKASANPK